MADPKAKAERKMQRKLEKNIKKQLTNDLSKKETEPDDAFAYYFGLDKKGKVNLEN